MRRRLGRRCRRGRARRRRAGRTGVRLGDGCVVRRGRSPGGGPLPARGRGRRRLRCGRHGGRRARPLGRGGGGRAGRWGARRCGGLPGESLGVPGAEGHGSCGGGSGHPARRVPHPPQAPVSSAYGRAALGGIGVREVIGAGHGSLLGPRWWGHVPRGPVTVRAHLVDVHAPACGGKHRDLVQEVFRTGKDQRIPWWGGMPGR